jgi:hypothetical protein
VRIRDAGFAARTQLIFTWDRPVQGKVLKDDVLREAVNIEAHAQNLLGEQASTKKKGKENGGSGDSGLKKMPKWLGKLAKK